MSKRTDTIKSLFTAAQSPALSADNMQGALPRVSSGSVRSLKDTFSGVEKENEELRERIASGAMILEIDPSLIDPSPLADRFRDQDDRSFEALKQSIAQRGQEVPILVREHPEAKGRYQSAYGHRRVRATRELGIQVKAILRSLSDEALVVAQGLENAPREDLSFIERATFAMHIEDAGHSRSIVQDALSIDRAEASKLLAVARSVPTDVIHAIGKAPKVGRGRWQSFAELIKDDAALKRVRAAIAEPIFAERETDARFLAAFTAASRPSSAGTSKAAEEKPVFSVSGDKIAHVRQAERELKLTLDKNVSATFAAFLVDQLPTLFDAFSKTSGGQETSEA
ncbi:chromosome partitioning protein ParB [Bradyrhizobium sp. CCBAU 51745]|uniref:plasmid partitioning protein RepB n=1 Tax=Bradyrhizobium sp. CCBAU 51745 TaxID=1325099 RepID=UPI00230625E0|nr:plasmid partitioning protein RepB [Bradyrhizobium sp. CCBAU 51745]MDA9438831.1 chromosome partitioning protein ParB [Bradyrhizobium sp. CCBAU 51745]